MTHPDRVYSREQLLDRVWGGNVYVEERTVDVHIRRLRKALEPSPATTVRADRARRGLPVLPQDGLSHADAPGGSRSCGSPVALAIAVAGRPHHRPHRALAHVLGAILAWQLVNLFRLQYWLRHRAHEDPPDIGGVWGDVIAHIVRIYRRKRFHKRA